MRYQDWRQRLLYTTSPAKQLMTKLVRRYRAGRPVVYDEQIATEPALDQQSIEPELYEGQFAPSMQYEPIQLDLPEFQMPDLPIQRPEPTQVDVSEPLDIQPTLEDRIQDPIDEIQQAIDEIREPEDLEELLRMHLFPPLL
jgi:hypothetical protein